MSTASVNAQLMTRVWSIANWGIAGAIMVGLPGSLLIDEDGAAGFMTFGFISFMVVRGLLMWWEFRDSHQGF